jgi:hypothetical protein
MYQMAIKYTTCPLKCLMVKNVLTFSIPRPQKYTKLGFCGMNMYLLSTMNLKLKFNRFRKPIEDSGCWLISLMTVNTIKNLPGEKCYDLKIYILW